MLDRPASPAIAELRQRIERLEGARGGPRAVLPFGVSAIDRRLPEGGLALGCLHEVAGGGSGAVDGAAAALFAAGVVARTKGNLTRHWRGLHICAERHSASAISGAWHIVTYGNCRRSA